MIIESRLVAEIVAEASRKMSDPNYSAVMVGGFVQQQPPASHYVSSYEQELGGAEAVVHVIFLASLLGLCFQRAKNRSVPSMSFEDLDHVAGGDAGEKLTEQQPAIREYIDSNTDHPVARKVLYLLALAMDSML